MPVIELMPFRHTQSCSINAQGTVSFPLPLLEKLNWSFGAKIAVSYIAAPVILLLHKAPDGRPGFTLSPLNHGNPGQSGGKITCAQFAQRVLHPRLVLPIRGIVPVSISVAPYELALMLQLPNWVTTEFSQAGCQKIPADLKGVYELLDGDQSIVRVGEGSVASRVKQHLKDENTAQAVRAVRYCGLADKQESALVEKILLAEYERDNGRLPAMNAIRA